MSNSVLTNLLPVQQLCWFYTIPICYQVNFWLLFQSMSTNCCKGQMISPLQMPWPTELVKDINVNQMNKELQLQWWLNLHEVTASGVVVDAAVVGAAVVAVADVVAGNACVVVVGVVLVSTTAVDVVSGVVPATSNEDMNMEFINKVQYIRWMIY